MAAPSYAILLTLTYIQCPHFSLSPLVELQMVGISIVCQVGVEVDSDRYAEIDSDMTGRSPLPSLTTTTL